MKRIVAVIATILMFVACDCELDSIYNHRGEVILFMERITPNTTKVITRAQYEDKFQYNEFRVYNSEAAFFIIGDTIK